MKLGFLWGAAGSSLSSVSVLLPACLSLVVAERPFLSVIAPPLVLPFSSERRDSSSTWSDFGRYMSSGSMAEFREKWNRAMKIR